MLEAELAPEEELEELLAAEVEDELAVEGELDDALEEEPVAELELESTADVAVVDESLQGVREEVGAEGVEPELACELLELPEVAPELEEAALELEDVVLPLPWLGIITTGGWLAGIDPETVGRLEATEGTVELWDEPV